MSACDFFKQVEEKRKYVRFCQALYWFCMEFNKFNTTGAQNIKFYLWYETEIILKYVFSVKSQDFARYKQHCLGRHFVTLLIYVNHLWFINF